MIVAGELFFELEIRPKLPENATQDRQKEIMGALHKMLTEGVIYCGDEEAQIRTWNMQQPGILHLQIRLPNGRITIS
jgi:hypothetical protein